MIIYYYLFIIELFIVVFTFYKKISNAPVDFRRFTNMYVCNSQ